MQEPTIGRIVIYHTTQEERDAMEQSYKRGHYQNTHDKLPAIIVAVWGEEIINARVFIDGFGEDLWKTSIGLGEGEGQWSWPLFSSMDDHYCN